MAGKEDIEAQLRWYEAEVLLADLTGHRHTMRGACANEIEARMRQIYPAASTVLVRPEDGSGSSPSSGQRQTPITSWWPHSGTGGPGKLSRFGTNALIHRTSYSGVHEY